MEPQFTKTGIIYCRVSSKEQLDGTSLEMQEKLCRDYAEKQGVQVLEVFIEKGESAKTTERTQFTKAIALCSRKKPKVDFFVVYKLDRFARNQDDHVIVKQMLRKYGTELRSATEPINDTPVGRAMEGMISVFAEFDNNIRRERCMSGMKERIRQGVWCWHAPIGYYRAVQAGPLVVDTKTAPYIRLAFEEYAKGIYTYDSLAKFLAQRGFKTKRGKAPSKQLLEKILKNPLYCGLLKVWGEEIKSNFEPIISSELFRKCQDSCRHVPALQVAHVAQNPMYPLRRVVACSICRTPFTGSASRGKMGKRYPYYHHTNLNCPNAFSIPKHQLEEEFIRYLEFITPKPKYEKLLKETIMDFWKKDTHTFVVQKKKLLQEIDQLEVEKQKVFEFYQSGKYTEEEFRLQKRILVTKVEQRQRLLEDYTLPKLDMEKALDATLTLVRNTTKVWVESDYTQKIHFQKLIFAGGRVEYDGQNFRTPQLGLIYEKNKGLMVENTSATPTEQNPHFGTPDLSLIYALNQEYDGTKSSLVDLTRRFWNRWVKELQEWKLFSDSLKSLSKD